MKVGYACINMTLPSKFKTCRLKTVESEGIQKVKELSLHNLHETLRIIQWNIEHGIYFYRMSSDLIPFCTHPVMTWEWDQDEDVRKITDQIKELQQKHDLRLSVHPGQYTLLNSLNEEIVRKSIVDLTYHLTLLELTGGSDMILHVGGAYGDKESAKKRFVSVYKTLPDPIKAVLRIENDDKIFTAEDVLELCGETGASACFDIHHHVCNHESDRDVKNIIDDVVGTWKHAGMKPKMHISSGKTSRTDRSHHEFVFEDDWCFLLEKLNGHSVDVMVEAKMKEQAVLRIKELYEDCGS